MLCSHVAPGASVKLHVTGYPTKACTRSLGSFEINARATAVTVTWGQKHYDILQLKEITCNLFSRGFMYTVDSNQRNVIPGKSLYTGVGSERRSPQHLRRADMQKSDARQIAQRERGRLPTNI